MLQIETGVSKRQGGRPHMEDEYLIFDSLTKKVIDSEKDAETVIEEFPHSSGSEKKENNNTTNNNKTNYALFGVFDGHGSDKFSYHAKKHFQGLLEEDPDFQKGDYQKALLNVFGKENLQMKTDLFDPAMEKVLHKEVDQGTIIEPTNKEERQQVETEFAFKVGGGTTVTLALLVDSNQLYVANAGDSRAVLGYNDGQDKYKALRISKDHHPDDEKEKTRVEDAGGEIRSNRVRGEGHAINMTRALGDFDFKTPFNRSAVDFITWVPTLTKVELTPANEFMILASDGLWAEFSDEEVVDFVAKSIARGHTAEEISHKLVYESTKPQHSDNTTVIVLIFRWDKESAQHIDKKPKIEKIDVV